MERKSQKSERKKALKIKAVKIGFYFFNWGIFIFQNDEKEREKTKNTKFENDRKYIFLFF
jgi:hypothetical protein